MLRRVSARSERWPLARPFRISRGVKTAADVVVVEVSAGGCVGAGEAVPYARYGESPARVLEQIDSVRDALAAGLTREELQSELPPGAARNAIDCALWDLQAKQSGRSAAEIAGVPTPGPMTTAVTISLDTCEQMADAAAAVADAPLIKVKVSAEDALVRIEAVHAAAPGAQLIIDPNESWMPAQLEALLPRLAQLGVALLEQPIAASADAALEGLNPPVPICADEAAHTSADLSRVARRYQVVNIKLDKTGGLTEALLMRRRARELGLGVMVGCMVGTSLGAAPALLIAQDANFVDLDGPWWLAEDRAPAMQIARGRLTPPAGGWGAA
jgi:L-alanine-DL-glutamate epimerase-like enolase superfamily enzyme